MPRKLSKGVERLIRKNRRLEEEKRVLVLDVMDLEARIAELEYRLSEPRPA